MPVHNELLAKSDLPEDGGLQEPKSARQHVSPAYTVKGGVVKNARCGNLWWVWW